MKRDSIPSASGFARPSTGRHLSIGVLTLSCLGVTATGLALVGVVASGPQRAILIPALTTTAIYALFALVLHRRTRSPLLGEIGFLYLGFALAYTLLPAAGFLVFGFVFPPLVGGGDTIVLSPTPNDLGIHFWRHCLFVAMVALGYVFGRARFPQGPPEPTRALGGAVTGLLWPIVVVATMTGVLLMSAPVDSYIEHYTRFDHLSWLARRVVYVLLMLKSGGYLVLLTVLVTRPRYRALLPAALLGIATYETLYSFGARIDAFIPVLTGLLLFHLHVKPIPMRRAGFVLMSLAATFFALGLFRAGGYDAAGARRVLLSQTGEQLIEFASVYTAGFHLYHERDLGQLPPRPPAMAVYEFVALIPFVDHVTGHPQYWYQRNYFPGLRVPGHTLGVIADSAIWGGEVDLLVRALLNGLLFGLVARWYFRDPGGPLKLSLYAYLCATSIMTLKYSVFYQLVLVWRAWLPAVALAWLISRLLSHRHVGVLPGSQPDEARA